MNKWLFSLVRVSQGNNHGCGIAAVATVCGITYERARSEFFPKRSTFIDNSSLWVTGKQMMTVIRRLGFSVVEAGSFANVNRPTIITFSWNPGATGSTHHCVVWDPFEKRIIDPGFDHEFSHDKAYYFDLWKRERFKVHIVTGRAR